MSSVFLRRFPLEHTLGVGILEFMEPQPPHRIRRKRWDRPWDVRYRAAKTGRPAGRLAVVQRAGVGHGRVSVNVAPVRMARPSAVAKALPDNSRNSEDTAEGRCATNDEETAKTCLRKQQRRGGMPPNAVNFGGVWREANLEDSIKNDLLADVGFGRPRKARRTMKRSRKSGRNSYRHSLAGALKQILPAPLFRRPPALAIRRGVGWDCSWPTSPC